MSQTDTTPVLDPLSFRANPLPTLLDWVERAKSLPGTGTDYGYRWQSELTAIDGDLKDLGEMIAAEDWEAARWQVTHLLRASLKSADRRSRAEQVAKLLAETSRRQRACVA